MCSRPQFTGLTYMGGTGPYGPMTIVFGGIIQSQYTSLYIKFGVNRTFHVLKITVYRFDLYGRYQTLWTDDDNFWHYERCSPCIVWCDLWAGGITDSCFYKDIADCTVTVNGARHLPMLSNFLLPKMQQWSSSKCGFSKMALHVTQQVQLQI